MGELGELQTAEIQGGGIALDTTNCPKGQELDLGVHQTSKSRTCELVELEDGIFEGGDVAQGGRDGAKNGVVGDVKVAQLLCIADAGWDYPSQLIVVNRQHLREFTERFQPVSKGFLGVLVRTHTQSCVFVTSHARACRV